MALTGCALRYADGPEITPTSSTGGSHYNLAPYVKLTLGAGTFITVGNQSSPALGHNAIIKSFEYGSTDGATAKFTIHDQGGGSFGEFMDNVVSKIRDAGSDHINAKFEFGWIRSDCPSSVAVHKSPEYNLTLINAETNFADGKFMYDIIAKDITTLMWHAHSDKSFGQDGAAGGEDGTSTANGEIPLRQALKDLLTDSTRPPYVSSISFKTCRGGNVREVGFLDPKRGDTQGPRGSWRADQRGKLETAREWIRPWLSENEKTFVMEYNEQNPSGEIIFWEDGVPDCGEDPNPKCIGTYVVNGGNDGAVIEFNPQIGWTFTVLQHGGAASENLPLANPDLVGHQRGRKNCPQLSEDSKKGAGSMMVQPLQHNVKNIYQDKPEEKMEEGQNLQARALAFAQPSAIEADLVVVGNPKLLPKEEGMNSKVVAIVFINPYSLQGGGGSCPEWKSQGLGGGPCNLVLSNKRWYVKSITHRINPGSYTTILRVSLPSPGIDFDPGTPLGGPGSNGYVLP